MVATGSMMCFVAPQDNNTSTFYTGLAMITFWTYQPSQHIKGQTKWSSFVMHHFKSAVGCILIAIEFVSTKNLAA